MVRMRFVLLALVAACGSETDDRPATLSFITETILKPACANAECHSSFKLEQGYSFSTVDEARASFLGDPQLADLDNANTGGKQALIGNLTQETENSPRMPYDQPLPNADVALIQEWLDRGLPGICAPGKTMVCFSDTPVACTADGAYDLDRLADFASCAESGGKCIDGACQ